MENQLKDEQIRNQAETIQGLERKVESLERELQKCLDPDSGEINPAIKYEYKTGEAKLLQKIQTLERQLTDCLDTPESVPFRSDIKYNRGLVELITNVGAGVFMPVSIESPSAEGRTIEHDRLGAWISLVYILIERPEFLDLWRNDEFRAAVNLINETNGYLRAARSNEKDASEQYALAGEYLCIGTLKEHEAIKTLRIVAERLYKIEWSDMDIKLETDEIDYIMFSLHIIIQCQRLHLSMKQ